MTPVKHMKTPSFARRFACPPLLPEDFSNIGGPQIRQVNEGQHLAMKKTRCCSTMAGASSWRCHREPNGFEVVCWIPEGLCMV